MNSIRHLAAVISALTLAFLPLTTSAQMYPYNNNYYGGSYGYVQPTMYTCNGYYSTSPCTNTYSYTYPYSSSNYYYQNPYTYGYSNYGYNSGYNSNYNTNYNYSSGMYWCGSYYSSSPSCPSNYVTYPSYPTYNSSYNSNYNYNYNGTCPSNSSPYMNTMSYGNYNYNYNYNYNCTGYSSYPYYY